MKRKGGNKKTKGKRPKVVSTNDVTSNASLDIEENSVMAGFDNPGGNSFGATETKKLPSTPSTNEPEKVGISDIVERPISSTFGKVVYTRVKVKIKTSKVLEYPRAISDAPDQSDTDKSSQQVSSEKPVGINEKMEESSISLSENNRGVSDNTTSKKSSGIKIKSSRGLGVSSMSPCSNTEAIKEELLEKKYDGSFQQESTHKEQELRLALEVIRKVMKMDAAEPFNSPVDAVSLGIPDYFDVIDTPMDFGTICHNLEKGLKYKNAEDVLNDVQYIWANCYKYNNKGDFIVDLMKRVKKSFTKYWTAVGLFIYQNQETLENDSFKDSTTPSEATMPIDGSALILSGKKFHGLKKHKEGCLCAICVMMRRRQEKEEIARMMGQTEGSDDSQDMDNKPEGVSHGESPFDEYTSSNMGNSPDVNADQELKLGHLKTLYHKQNIDVTASGKQEDTSQRWEIAMNNQEGSGGSLLNDADKETAKKNDDGNAGIDQQRPKESLAKNERVKMLENLRYLENPVLLDLYGTLFSNRTQSFWNGPHSLVGGRMRSNRRAALCATIAAFMK